MCFCIHVLQCVHVLNVYYLQVLRRYPCLWNMQKPVKERPKLVIVNLQWTPKDDLAFLKINGKFDFDNNWETRKTLSLR